MDNDIINFIKKQDNIFDAAKYFGGITRLRELSKTNDELKSLIDSNSYGNFEIRHRDKKHNFKFYILDYDIEDEVHVNLIVNLIVDYPNLNEDELITIGRWVGEFCDDGQVYTVTTPVGLFSEDSYYMVMIEEINGKRVPWKLGSLLDDPDNLVKDEVVYDLLDKSDGKEPVTESLIKLQSLFCKTL